ncbi:hypothetical protein Thiowin_01529 [Thiorhodovibrio winogradskyi]|uniref:Uncharacterized protein n=1 Tax=Thiorhodovibrio winogradskyi TaxID=77007 RepID=A0ABZ0S6J1_9GAMM
MLSHRASGIQAAAIIAIGGSDSFVEKRGSLR